MAEDANGDGLPDYGHGNDEWEHGNEPMDWENEFAPSESDSDSDSSSDQVVIPDTSSEETAAEVPEEPQPVDATKTEQATTAVPEQNPNPTAETATEEKNTTTVATPAEQEEKRVAEEKSEPEAPRAVLPVTSDDEGSGESEDSLNQMDNSNTEGLFLNNTENGFRDIVKSWWEKPIGAELTDAEAKFQITFGSVEMAGGLGGVFVSSGWSVFPSLYIMSDGANLIQAGINNEKAFPLEMFLRLAIPIVNIGDEVIMALPLP